MIVPAAGAWIDDKNDYRRGASMTDKPAIPTHTLPDYINQLRVEEYWLTAVGRDGHAPQAAGRRAAGAA